MFSETVSIAHSIATNPNFNLKLYKDVYVNKVDPQVSTLVMGVGLNLSLLRIVNPNNKQKMCFQLLNKIRSDIKKVWQIL